jgi:glucose-1-phosphate adenylyltransferase
VRLTLRPGALALTSRLRLAALTKQRAKPAVPIGGAYRLIDVPMSNCINSGIQKMYVLTQVSAGSASLPIPSHPHASSTPPL